MPRLDVALVEQGLFASRERAKRAIEQGYVWVDGAVIRKPSYFVSPGQNLSSSGDPVPFVSRGGLKLEHALVSFGISVEGKHAIDVGASTGGFTQVLLERGVDSVCCVDVGHGQLAEALRQEKRVRNLEGTDLRRLDRERYGDRFDFACVDVSFVSLTLILPALFPLCKKGSDVICLVKPQFEVGRSGIGKNGVVKKLELQEQAVASVCACGEKTGYSVHRWLPSPIKGGDGNQEYLLWLST